VVQGRQTSADTLATCVEFARQLNKHPVVVKDCPGFLVNRILFPYFHGFDLLVKQGVSIDRIDRVMEEFGWSMGPGYLADVIGMDVMVGADAVLQRGYPERMGYNEPSVFEQLLEQGMLGQKSGAGFYRHSLTSSGERLRVINREAVNHYLCADREVSDDDIHWRMMLPMLTEALRTLNEEVVSGPEDLTLAAKLGLGFPDHQGGLWGYIEALDTVELQRLLSRYKPLGELYNYG
jgi:3-hydroxyacyl-CoA dehydrogenase/enoyl-CoA hydratase/3-hydroxybutyryl-CoA epimerase/enoyl-CoA isomerase